MHGHQVGGTNPSLVEALGAGNVVVAHDNAFNRWVAGPDQFYFGSEDVLDSIITNLEDGNISILPAKSAASAHHLQRFTLEKIHKQYEAVLERLLG
jgi:hypothetical protein